MKLAPEISYRAVAAAETHMLRQAVLHPDRTGGALEIAGDGTAASLHVGAFHDGALVGIGSVLAEALPDSMLRDTWRIVGIAVEPRLRGRGIGGEILERLLAHAGGHGSKLAWCNSRVPAASLYRRYGFTSTPPYDLANDEGPRLRMTCRLERAAPVHRGTTVTDGDVVRTGIYKRLSRATVFKDTVHIGGLLPNRSDISAGEQTREVLEKIDAVLARVGSSKSKLISAMVWLKDIATVDEANEVWEAWVPAGYAPARSCVQAIPGSPEFAVEIAAMAAL
jgi:enamine deaminase RidA (YjgF/YER057c/UK114 family)